MGEGEPARARMWEAGGRWFAHVLDVPAYIEVTGTSRGSCLAELRKATGDDVDLMIEVIPAVVGVAEAAEIMGWDKRRVITYIDRGSFPEPIDTLASGRIWLREDVEEYADRWRASHPPRRVESPKEAKSKKPGPKPKRSQPKRSQPKRSQPKRSQPKRSQPKRSQKVPAPA